MATKRKKTIKRKPKKSPKRSKSRSKAGHRVIGHIAASVPKGYIAYVQGTSVKIAPRKKSGGKRRVCR